MSRHERNTDRTGSVLVPVFSDHGRSHTWSTIDEADFYAASEYRWHSARGYARSIYRRRPDGLDFHFLHRLVLGLRPADGLEVDHINRDPLDNRRENLRIVSHAENMQNVTAIGGTSQYRGVTWDKERRKWVAQAQLRGRNHFLGRFDDEEIAAAVAAAFRAKHMPFSEERAA